MADLIDRDVFLEKYGNYYAEEGPTEGFIGTVGDLINEQPAVNRWISVEDALPEEDVSVLCYMRIGEIAVMEYGGDGWFSGITRYNTRAVTHWCPLPEPPEVKQE